MSKILSCWFWKPKTKSLSKKENKTIQNIYVEDAEPIIKGESKCRGIVESEIVLPLYIKKAESLNISTAYFKKLSELKFQTKKVKSYPASPRKIFLEEKVYLSDQNLHAMSRYKLHSKYSNSELSASTPQNSSNYNPRATLGSSEPFPFQVPRDSAPRQSLFYEFRYGDTDNSENNENSKFKAEKPMEDYNNPNTCGRKRLYESSTHKRQLQNQDNLEIRNDKSNTRITIPHVRVSVHKTLRESKQFQAVSRAPSKSLVRQLQLKPTNKTPLLITNEGKVLHPVKTDKVRSSVLRSTNEKPPPVSVSIIQPVKPLELEEAVSTTPSRRSFRRSSIGNFQDINADVGAEKQNRSSLLFEREASPTYVGDDENLYTFPETPARKSIRRSSVRSARGSQENNAFPYVKTVNEPAVYAVPVVPTRGRSKSLLQQSVKSLASKNQREEQGIYRKNVRYSMDTDVFSADTRRRSVSPASPGYVNMERGQPMLVSEVLNPITSLFISDLKNPVPKDPIQKPKEANIWVKPRRLSTQRSSFSKQPPQPVKRIQTPAYESPAPTTRTVPVQRRLSKKSRYKYQEESSSSDESIVVYRKKSKQYAPGRSYHQAVYAAQLPNSVLPQPDHNHRSSLYLPGKSAEHEVYMAKTSSSIDICGLTLGSDQKIFENMQSPYNVKMVSSAQQTDIEDELDLICYPSESVLKKSVVSSESGSKLRWRIIIKRGEEK